MLEFVLIIITVLSAILALIQKDLLKAAILTGFSGGALALLFQILLAPDVALTQAIVGAAIVPVFIALAVKKLKGRINDGSNSAYNIIRICCTCYCWCLCSNFVDNIIKKIIGINFIEEGANLFIVTIGYKPGGVVPILMPNMDTSWFATNAAYPLPFGLVLTSIVIGASTLAVMLALVMVLYKRYGTLSTRVMLADTAKQEEFDE